MKNTGVTQKAIVFNSVRKFLALKRSSTAPNRPNTWDLPGGELDFGEQAKEGILREIREETGLEAANLKLSDVESHISHGGSFWVTICYTAETGPDRVKLSFEHNEYKWVTKEEFLKFESSPRLMRFVGNLVDIRQ